MSRSDDEIRVLGISKEIVISAQAQQGVAPHHEGAVAEDRSAGNPVLDIPEIATRDANPPTVLQNHGMARAQDIQDTRSAVVPVLGVQPIRMGIIVGILPYDEAAGSGLYADIKGLGLAHLDLHADGPYAFGIG